MKFLEKIRQLPLETRKAILWTVTIIVGIFLFFFWLKIFIIKK